MKNHFPHSLLRDAVASGHDRHFAALELIAAQATAVGATIANVNAVAPPRTAWRTPSS